MKNVMALNHLWLHLFQITPHISICVWCPLRSCAKLIRIKINAKQACMVGNDKWNSLWKHHKELVNHQKNKQLNITAADVIIEQLNSINNSTGQTGSELFFEHHHWTSEKRDCDSDHFSSFIWLIQHHVYWFVNRMFCTARRDHFLIMHNLHLFNCPLC